MMSKQTKKTFKPREIREVYSRIVITRTITLPINVVAGQELHQTIESTISQTIEGKCIVEGFVKKNSVKVLTFSSGLVKGDSIIFDVVFECLVFFPVAGMLLNCVAKNVNKAGIRAESSDEMPSPFVVFIARDHYYNNEYFNKIEPETKFVARVIVQRFELEDKYVSVIAELDIPKEFRETKKALLIMEE